MGFKVNLGCGPNPKEGFIGVDSIAFGHNVVADLGRAPWVFKEPYEGLSSFPDSSVEEASCSHFLEHLTNLNDRWERINFFNELYRVLEPGGKIALVFPHWCSNRYYGDPTHKEPFSEMGFYYLDRKWREEQAPHTDRKHVPFGYDCDFEQGPIVYALHPDLVSRNAAYQKMATTFWKDAALDLQMTLTARK